MERKPLKRELKALICLVAVILAVVALGRFNPQVRAVLSLLSFETEEKQQESFRRSHRGTLVAKGENILVILDDYDRAISFEIDELTRFRDSISPGDRIRVMAIYDVDSVEPYPARNVQLELYP